MFIEHWVPRSGYRNSDTAEKQYCGERTLDWINILGVCVGVSIGPGEAHRHCDRSRGNKRLSLCPNTLPNIEDRFRYVWSTGEMIPTDQDAEADRDALNLDNPRLRANRAVVVANLRNSLRRDDSTQNIRRLWRTATEGEHLSPYAHVARQYLRKKMAQRNLL